MLNILTKRFIYTNVNFNFFLFIMYFDEENCNIFEYDEIKFKKVSTDCQILFFNDIIYVKYFE